RVGVTVAAVADDEGARTRHRPPVVDALWPASRVAGDPGPPAGIDDRIDVHVDVVRVPGGDHRVHLAAGSPGRVEVGVRRDGAGREDEPERDDRELEPEHRGTVPQPRAGWRLPRPATPTILVPRCSSISSVTPRPLRGTRTSTARSPRRASRPPARSA